MNIKPHAAIILAAGFSSRMGAFKPLLALGHQTVVDRVISIFQKNSVDVILVVGWNGDELAARIKNPGITIIENPDYERGMFTSIQAGVRNLPPHCEAFFIMPVDIPLVRPATIARIIESGKSHREKIIYPVFGDKRGHPPLLPRRLATSIAEWPEGGNLGVILESCKGMSLDVKVPDSHILFNLNTPEDYKLLLERFQRYDVPTETECTAIMNDICMVPLKVQQHCAKVAEVAVKIGKALNRAGGKTDLEVIRIAAALHDIAKGQPKHDIAGGELLHSFGFGRIGDVIAIHTDLSGEETEAPLEAKIVYLADKLVSGEKLVSIEERYQSSRERFAANPEIGVQIARRKQRALRVEREIETLCGCPLEQVVFP